jgi:HSP20 family protein
MKPLREGAIKRKTVKPNKTKEDKIMTPARTNQNWLPGIFNEILGDNWLAERRSTTAPPPSTSSTVKTNTRSRSPLRA